MKTAGIICECNPLHGGHLRLLDCARASGADAVIALMSGCFVQRGDAAVADPYARAEILIRSGFDAVLELPYPYAASGAEFFGGAGIDILSRLGVDEVWFGSESGDLQMLSSCAAVADSEAFSERYAAMASSTEGTAKTYFELLRELCADSALQFDPNDILALSYLRAIRKSGGTLRPVTVARSGSGYRETELTPHVLPSATALRRVWKEQGLDAVRDQLPPACAHVLETENAAGRAPASLECAERAILAYFRLTPHTELKGIAELGGGLGARIAGFSCHADSLKELLALCATKKYTDARMRRGILFAMTRVTPTDLRRPAAYVRLLAANRTGCAFLSSVRRTSRIPLVTRQSGIPNTADAQKQALFESRSRAFFTLCQPTLLHAAPLLCRTPFILDAENEKKPKKS